MAALRYERAQFEENPALKERCRKLCVSPNIILQLEIFWESHGGEATISTATNTEPPLSRLHTSTDGDLRENTKERRELSPVENQAVNKVSVLSCW